MSTASPTPDASGQPASAIQRMRKVLQLGHALSCESILFSPPRACDCYLREQGALLEAALAQAREEGRCAGLEEAARWLEGSHPGDVLAAKVRAMAGEGK